MKLRRVSVFVLVAIGVYGCTKKPRPVAVAPQPARAASVDSTAIRAARDQARRDSIAAAERVGRDNAERDRTARTARVRETLSDIVYFEYDSDQLTSEAQDRLRTKVAILRANPTLQLQVEGHADERGSTEYNLALGQRRAETVRDFMTSYGVDGSRIMTISFGEERPIVEGSDEAAWAKNRRAEFSITGGQVTTIPPEVQ
jgi:peptidoglycan-associated lipoprotein